MTTEQINVKVDKQVKKRIQELVDQEKYSSISEFVKQAILKELHYCETGTIEMSEMIKVLDTPEGREKISAIMKDIFNEKFLK